MGNAGSRSSTVVHQEGPYTLLFWNSVLKNHNGDGLLGPNFINPKP